VRACAVEAMEALRLPDRDGVIEGWLAEPHEGLRRAAVGYLLSMGPEPVPFARRLLDGDDPTLRQYLLDALGDHPYEAQRALTWDWIDARIKSGRREDLLAAAQSIGALGGPTTPRLLTLLASRDVEVRRAVLLAAARRPSPELLDVLLPLLVVPDLDPEARNAVAAIGDPAVPALQRLLEGKEGERAQSRAAAVLAQIASPIAIEGLMSLVRSGDLRLRHLGLQGMTRVRHRAGRPVLPLELVHRLFHRELRDYRVWRAPVAALEKHAAPEVRLLGESFQESADWALERAFQALACWYEPRPLSGVLSRLKSRDLAVSSPALEYLGHVLPRADFKPVSRIFEQEAIRAPEGASAVDPLDESIRVAWETGDAWLRACAVRASRHAPGFDRGRFAAGDDGNPMVRAELESLGGDVGAASKGLSC
jgi:HEAT repeat protein